MRPVSALYVYVWNPADLSAWPGSFERRKKGSRVTYHFIGYTTFYAFFHWPSGKRLRLAYASSYAYFCNR